MAIYDLSSLSEDAEPVVVRVGGKAYTANLDTSAVFYERVLGWCNGLLAADEDEADRQSIPLVAKAYDIDESEAGTLRRRWRRDMLVFFVTAPAPQIETTTS